MPKVADFIEQHRERLVQRFAEEAIKLESARGLRGYELANTFPEYLGALAALSREGHGDEREQVKRRLEETHLSLRLRLGYNQEEVTSEYVLIGRLIAGLWEGLPREQQPEAEDTARCFAALQDAMDHAIVVFSGYSVEDRQREKRALRRLDALAPESILPDSEPDLLRQRFAPLMRVIEEAMGAQGAELYLVDEAGRQLVTVAATGRCAEHPPEGLQARGLRSLLGLRLWPHGSLLSRRSLSASSATICATPATPSSWGRGRCCAGWTSTSARSGAWHASRTPRSAPTG